MTIDMDGDLIDDIRQGSYSMVQLRAENARLQAALAQATDAEADAVQRAQALKRELDIEAHLHREYQGQALRQAHKLNEARAEIERLERTLDRVAMEVQDD